VVDALGQRTEYAYDAVGNHINQPDANGHTTSFEYDALGRRIVTILPLGQRSETSYNAVGLVVATTNFNGDTITYEYDARNRLMAKRFPDSTSVLFTYTLTGQRETVTNSRGVTTFTYDARGRLLSRTDPDGTNIAYTYDITGNRTSVTITSGTTAYTYDALNRMETVTDPDGGVTTYTYDALGRLIRTDLPNGTFETLSYDVLNRLLSVEHTGPGGIFASFNYTYDAVGNRIAVDELGGRRVEYTYDALNRLIAESITDPANGNRTIAYTYDAVGNRLSRNDSTEGTTTYTYDYNDRLLTETLNGQITTYTYDDNGNTITKNDGTVTVTYYWNYENHLVAVDTDGDGVIDVEYFYDAIGIRVAKIENGQETRFLTDTNRRYAQVLEEYAPGGTAEVSYVYGIDLISQKRDTGRSFHHVDGLGSTRALTNEAGIVTDTYIYDAFGRIIVQTGSTPNLYLFAGEQRDFSIGLDYLRARYINYNLGRFQSMDSFPGILRLPITLQKYIYANANPITYVDPTGYVGLLEVMTAIHSQAILASQTMAQLVVGWGTGVYVQTHIVNWPRWLDIPTPTNAEHISIKMVVKPEDLSSPPLSKWANEFSNRYPLNPKYYYATLGAKNEGGILFSHINQMDDLNQTFGYQVWSNRVLLIGQALAEAIDSLFWADSLYQDNLIYNFFPTFSNDGYNSNSYAAGIFRKADLQMPPDVYDRNVPGILKPIPI
jgi:RHS repeat-associated protein